MHRTAECCSNCDQGRKPCATPDVCRQPTDCDPHIGWGAFIPAFLALALVALCAALVLLIKDFAK